MKSSMRPWRRLVLVGMLAWGLLFLGLLSYILEARTDELLTAAGSLLYQHPDTRFLASVQPSYQQHPNVGARPGMDSPLTTTHPRGEPGPSTSAQTPESSQELSRGPDSAPYGSQEASRQDYLDPQSLAAWSSFGTENVGSHSDPGVQSRERTSQTAEYQNHVSTAHGQGGPGEEEEGGERENEIENEVEEPGNRMRSTSDRRAGGGGDTSDMDYDFYRSASLLQRLWRGPVFASMLKPSLQRARKKYISANENQVSYRGQRSATQSPKELLCQMKAHARLRTVDGSEQPFSSLGWAGLVPSVPLERRSGYRTCAVVSSAGAILHSRLGKEIDSHDAVLRFNAAPTEGYERDVGNKTTIRIMNSQILAKPRYRFNTLPIYKNVTLVAWDPAPYTVNLHEWYANPDYNLFDPYVERRKLHPDQAFYILHPSYLWQLWDVIQGNTQEDIQPNPPSSGFIGIVLMMALCEQVHVYEYIPSTRQTDLCHYHERFFNAACTMGAYHPLLYEKNLIRKINTGPESDLRRKGRVTLPGFSTVNCDM